MDILNVKLKEEPNFAEDVNDTPSMEKNPGTFGITTAVCKTELDDTGFGENNLKQLNIKNELNEDCKFHEVSIKIEKSDSDMIDATEMCFIDPSDIKLESEPEKQNTERNNNSKTKKRTSPKTSQSKIHSCDLCSYSTKIPWNLKKHKLVHKKNCKDPGVERYKCTSCSYETLTKGNMLSHIPVHDKSRARMYPCSYCDFVAYRKGNLACHEARHVGAPGKYTCPHCDNRYKAKISVDHHILISHPEFIESISSQVYECSFCSFKTVRKGLLPDHLLKHTQENAIEYKCNTCGYSTYKKYSYTLHMRIHAGDTDFTCEICERGFNHRYHFQEHILRRHSKDENMLKRVVYKIYTCNVCEYKTVLFTNLRKHKHKRRF
ncbi:unnamed protein product [Callosobruchus maculatus]|uniref:C2H2-type domain-containing protein n=1 Tax=Callosobruchus maculatus TaxID=64391 RepID=A0A653CG06_CALMS|nr:unnamed protein product [Callosobruchus maculatus]